MRSNSLVSSAFFILGSGNAQRTVAVNLTGLPGELVVVVGAALVDEEVDAVHRRVAEGPWHAGAAAAEAFQRLSATSAADWDDGSEYPPPWPPMERRTWTPLDWQCLMSAPTAATGWPEMSRPYLPLT
uniref:Uncharacterized protein n=1 Tax=Oryza nivara TaxID=4536 RepID=A0A0E0GJH8_ORYNI